MSEFKHTAYGAWLDKGGALQLGVIPSDLYQRYSDYEVLALTPDDYRQATEYKAMLELPFMKAMG